MEEKMEDADDAIRAIDQRIVEEDAYIKAHKVHLKYKISKTFIFVSFLGELLAIIYFFFTEKNLAVLLDKEANLMFIWTLVV